MSWKERIEENFTLFVLGLLAVGFGAGFGTYKAISDIAGPNASANLACVESAWTNAARQANWVPRNQFPAYPVSLNITSPGNGTSIPIHRSSESTSAFVDLVIQASRPLPKTAAVGLISNNENRPNYYLTFPYFDTDDVRVIFRKDRIFMFPFEAGADSQVNMWAVVVDDEKKFGSVYASLEQVIASGSGVIISPKTTVTVH